MICDDNTYVFRCIDFVMRYKYFIGLVWVSDLILYIPDVNDWNVVRLVLQLIGINTSSIRYKYIQQLILGISILQK